jgi:polysaccharide export outer membrane protein
VPKLLTRLFIVTITSALWACATGSAPGLGPQQAAGGSDDYIIGPGDTLRVFVWQHADVSTSVPVRPDGKISTPLVEDMQAVGKTPTQLARDMEVALSEYIRSPQVNIIVSGFIGAFNEQIRVVGQAAQPQSISYRDNMTILDVMIEVGGLAENAAGNRAKLVRKQGEEQIEFRVRLDDLLNKGKIEANVPVQPGDVLIIPESRL